MNENLLISENNTLSTIQSLNYCNICKLTASKYTCPRCNINYCSLNCYKSKNHLNCTESFYQCQVNEELKNERVDKLSKDCLKMFKILKKQKEIGDNLMPDKEDDNLSDNNNISNSYFIKDKKSMKFLSCMNAEKLENISVDELWKILPQNMKNEFERKIHSNDLNDLMELLNLESRLFSSSASLWKPWWTLDMENNAYSEVDKKFDTSPDQCLHHFANNIYSSSNLQKKNRQANESQSLFKRKVFHPPWPSFSSSESSSSQYKKKNEMKRSPLLWNNILDILLAYLFTLFSMKEKLNEYQSSSCYEAIKLISSISSQIIGSSEPFAHEKPEDAVCFILSQACILGLLMEDSVDLLSDECLNLLNKFENIIYVFSHLRCLVNKSLRFLNESQRRLPFHSNNPYLAVSEVVLLDSLREKQFLKKLRLKLEFYLTWLLKENEWTISLPIQSQLTILRDSAGKMKHLKHDFYLSASNLDLNTKKFP